MNVCFPEGGSIYTVYLCWLSFMVCAAIEKAVFGVCLTMFSKLAEKYAGQTFWNFSEIVRVKEVYKLVKFF